jgi:thiol-disulfide isomerase/thioredoxin
MKAFALLLPLLLLTPLAGAAAVSDPLPSDLDASFQAFLIAPADKKDQACNKFLGAYLPYLRSGKDSRQADAALVGYLSMESLSNLVTRLSIEGSFTPFLEACLGRLDSSGLTGREAEIASSAKSLHAGLKLLADNEALDQPEWTRIAQNLDAGWRFYPSRLYADKLRDALWRSGDRRGLFQFKAYRYIDESNPNPIRYVGLWISWLFLPRKQGFSTEMAIVKERIKQDILLRSQQAKTLPRFLGEVFYTTRKEQRRLSFMDERSSLYGKRAVFVFFQTTCPYCIADLTALGKLSVEYKKKAAGDFAIVGLKMPLLFPGPIGALEPLEKELNLPFELLENDESGIFKAYEVKHVPLLVFFDGNGVPLWTVTFFGQGHLEEKLSWFIDGLLSDTVPPVK